ncbi:hypothetical protein WMF39_26615 [Sorangium sp. So ce1504]|uniref:hypothetical protein n=1 Tax=Sorangium sp. So ce1504 TaxID=3133337 RepID=UPI003F5F2D53
MKAIGQSGLLAARRRKSESGSREHRSTLSTRMRVNDPAATAPASRPDPHRGSKNPVA